MFFRNEIKELITALNLTKELEEALIQDGAIGNSLSDKIKFYQEYDEDEYIETYGDEEYDEDELMYEFREYKRSLLGGLYNDLRWVAHERNQLMHFDDYIISDFDKFQSVTRKAIALLKGEVYKKSFFEYLTGALTIVSSFIIIIAVVYFEWGFLGNILHSYPEQIMKDFNTGNWVGLIISGVLSFFILSIALSVIVWALKVFHKIFAIIYHLCSIAFHNIHIFLLILLIIVLWNQDIGSIYHIDEKILQLWESL